MDVFRRRGTTSPKRWSTRPPITISTGTTTRSDSVSGDAIASAVSATFRSRRDASSWPTTVRLGRGSPDGFTKAMLLDNDPALYPDKLHDEIFRWFMSSGVRCSITQGYDIRCVTPDRAALLAELNPYDIKFHDHRLYIAWDYLGVEGFVRERVPMLLDAGLKGVNISCYMITGFAQAAKGPEKCPWDGADLRGPHAADLHRYEVLWKEYGVLPYVMIYNNERGDRWLRAFARFINRRVFKHTEWEDYDGWLSP